MNKIVRIEAKQISGYKAEAKARNHIVSIDQPMPAGEDSGPTPLEFFFISLAGSIIGTAYIISYQRRLTIHSMSVRVEGELESDIVNGRRSDERAGFQHIQATLEIDSDMTSAEKETFLSDVKRRCSVSENIRNSTPIEFRLM